MYIKCEKCQINQVSKEGELCNACKGNVETDIGNNELSQGLNEIINQLELKLRYEGDIAFLKKINETHRKREYKYEDEMHQLVYLYRYFYAFFCEYYEIFKSIKKYFNNLYVLSIGSGSGIDAFALYSLMKDSIYTYNYVGIEPVKWIFQDYFTKKKEKAKIRNLYFNKLKKDIDLEFNVVIFGKCLSEKDMSEKEFRDIVETIERCKFKENRIAVCFCTTDHSEDLRKKRVTEAFVKLNYLEEKKEKSKELVDCEKWTERIKAPKSLYNFYNNLFTFCKHSDNNYLICSNCGKCMYENGIPNIIDFPLLKTERCNFDIVYLRRNNDN